MKAKYFILLTMLTMLILSACGGATTPVSVQPQPAENTPSSPSVQEPAATQPSAQEMTKLKMTISMHTGYAPFFIADKEGYFKEFGVQVEFVPFNKTSEAIALLVSGDIDVFAGPLNTGLINVIGKEKNVQVVADRGHWQVGKCAYQAIVVRKDLFDSGKVTKAADFKGLSVATSTSGPPAYILSKFLEPAGLTLKDVVINDIPGEANIDAFKNKTLDVNIPPEPDLTLLMNAGDGVLLISGQDVLGDFQGTVVAFNKNLLVKNRDAGIRFLAAYLKAVRQLNEGKTDRNLAILAEATGESVETLKQVCWMPVDPNGLINYASVEAFQQWSIQQGQLETPVTQEQLWDPSMAAAAVKLLGQ